MAETITNNHPPPPPPKKGKKNPMHTKCAGKEDSYLMSEKLKWINPMSFWNPKNTQAFEFEFIETLKIILQM